MARTLLILDANTTVQRVAKLTFKTEGIAVNGVQAGRDPLELIAARPPDIILTDRASKVVAFLKTRTDLSHIPVVLLKGAFDPPATEEESVADAVLTKPLQPDAMVACVKRLLDRPEPPSARVVVEAQEKREQIDAGLDLEEYFDQLTVAFNRAEVAALHHERTEAPRSEVRPEPAPSPPAERPDLRERATRARQHPSSPDVNTELVEQITQRVLNQLNERMVRSTATEIVSRLSRWLIVNEVERNRPRTG